MPWFKVDDKFHSHPKTVAVSLRAVGLWIKAGSWSADQLTDGHIPKNMLVILGGTRADANALVGAGFWEVDGDGWVIHDWDVYQPSKSDALAKRESDRQRKAEARAAKEAKRDALK